MALPKENYARRIYLADDDEDDREMFAEIVKEIDNSISLTVAYDGCHLMQILDEIPLITPDVIFLDLNMPRKDGFECLEEIRHRDDQLKNANIIMFTTSEDPVSIATAFKLGATFYAVKPRSMEQWKSLLTRILHLTLATIPSKREQFHLN